MQSLDALLKLPDIDRDIIEKTVRDFLDCRARSDWKTYFSFLSPAAEITIVGDRGLHPYAGRYCGQEGIRQLLRRIDTEFIYVESQILDVVVDHDRAVVRRLKRMRQIGTGEVREQHFCTWVRFQNGLIIEIIEYSDTALTAHLATP
jgi:ketosteroid isomerase-like protein